ncbi:MAG: hypothetical protein CMM91_01630 [Rickettsiales bacterium]|nr:hypothetical protein [Rickettsiales bacterium]|tara:strand:- start:11076 stop:11870 length:795 start_codon:yes stop_codon:yes gene_type:complete
MTEILSTFNRDGVALIKNCLDDSYINPLRDEYNKLNDNVTNIDIPMNEPIVVLWTHVQGEQKRIVSLKDFPTLQNVIKKLIIPTLRNNLKEKAKRLQLLENVIFNKPPTKDNTLQWHQDVSYFPLKPNNQIAVWFTLDVVTKERGALCYALGSHKLGARGSTSLHTREKYDNENRPLIPENPETEGLKTKIFEMTQNDMLVHDGFTWHYSGPNQIDGFIRKGFSVRFITNETVFDPRPGQGAAFTKQINIKPGEKLIGNAFPLM